MNTIYLIGGAPTVGKSTAARLLAEKTKLPWISTDTLRDQMRGIVRKEDYPCLFSIKNKVSIAKTASHFLTSHTPAEIVAHQNAESQEVWHSARALISSDYQWGSFIIEGVAILPKFIAKLQVKGKRIKSIFLIDENVDRIRHIVYTRGLWDNAREYPDSVKEKEVQWVLEFNRKLISEAKQYKLPILCVPANRKPLLPQIRRVFEL